MKMTNCKGCNKEYPDNVLNDGKCKGCMSKGEENTVTTDELKKSMDKIEQLTKAETPEARKQDLLQKSLDGSATAEESVELASLLKGEKPAGADVAGDLTKSLTDGDDLQKSIDVSSALADLVGNLEKALGSVGEQIEKSASHQGEVNLVLAKGLLDSCKLTVQTNDLVKSLQTEIESYGRQPAGQRRSASTPADVVNKSHGGQAPSEDQITKSDVIGLMEAMYDEGRTPMAPCGEDLNKAIAKMESVGDVSAPMMRDLAAYRSKRMN